MIMEDGKKPNGVIPKIPQRDIMWHDVDRTINLHDCNMMKLEDAILTKEVSIKSNKLPGEQQHEGASLQDWCQTRKRMRIVMNELMVEFRGKDCERENSTTSPKAISNYTKFLEDGVII